MIKPDSIPKPVSIARAFTELVREEINNQAGYMDAGEINKDRVPEGAVTNCLNMRFMGDGSYRRPPYMLLYDLADYIPANYTIMRFCEKVFVDKAGTGQRVIIAAVQHEKTKQVKFFANYNYLAAPSYRNAWSTGNYTEGFRQEWFDITERYRANEDGYDFVYGNFPINAQSWQVRSTRLRFQQATDAFKGWYFVDGNGDIAGLITASIWDSATNKAYFKVALSSWARTSGYVGISRFPVNQSFNDKWADIKDVMFDTTSANMVRIYTGKGNRTLNFMLIKDRKSFNGYSMAAPVFNSARNTWLTKLQDYQGETGITSFSIKCVRNRASIPSGFYNYRFEWKHNLMSGYEKLFNLNTPLGTYSSDHWLFGGLGIRITVDAAQTLVQEGDEATISVIPSQHAQKYDGFFFDYDSPDILNKKVYTPLKIQDDDLNDDATDQKQLLAADIGKELGLSYDILAYKIRSSTPTDTKFRVYSLCVEIDGRQVYFIKHLYTGTHNISGTGEFHGGLTIDLNMETWFNPRLTGSLLFFHDDRITDPQLPESILPSTGKLLENDGQGYRPLYKLPVTSDDTKLTARLITSRGGYNSNNASTFPSDYATGMSLFDYLHNYYWKSVNVGAEGAVPAGLNLVAYGLDDEAIRKDNDAAGENIGSFSICLSQVQQGNGNTKSVMCTERVKQLTIAQPIKAAARTMGDQFLIFSRDESRWEDIIDEQTVSTRNIAAYQDDGVVNKEAIVAAIVPEEMQAGPPSAPYTSKFSGTFAAGYKSFYTYYNNKRIDLLEVKDEATGKVMISRWKKVYNKLSEAVKEACRVGYLSNNKEVFWSLNGYIFVWNIAFEGWTIYQFPDTIGGFVPELDGELYFWSGNKIYKTEPVETAEYKDKGTARIDFFFEKFYTFDREGQHKIFDVVDLNFEVKSAPAAGKSITIRITAVDNYGVTLFDRTETLNAEAGSIKETSVRLGSLHRVPSKWVKLTVSSVAANADNIEWIKVKGIKAVGLLAPGTVNTQ